MSGPYNYVALVTSDERLAATFANAVNCAGQFDCVLQRQQTSDKLEVMCPGQCIAETEVYFMGFKDAFKYLYQDPSTKR